MANYQLNYTGAEINTLLGKINSIETLLNSTATTLNNTVSQTTTNSNNITTLQNKTAYETTSFTAKGTTVSLYKWGRVVTLRVNANITSDWAAGSSAAVATGLADKWIPITGMLFPSLGFEMGGSKYIVFDSSGNFYHNGGSTMTSGSRLRATFTYVSKA